MATQEQLDAAVDAAAEVLSATLAQLKIHKTNIQNYRATIDTYQLQVQNEITLRNAVRDQVTTDAQALRDALDAQAAGPTP